MMKKRRWLLPVLLMIILVPVLSALIFSTRGLYAQRDAMVKMAERYSQTLARGIVRDESGTSTETPLQRHRRMGLFLKMLTVGPPVPGWIAVAGPNGVKLQGSPGSRITPELAAKVNQALATGEMQTGTIQLENRPPSAVAVYSYPDGLRAIVVVISHYLVPGPMMRLTMFQPVAGIIASALALFGIFLLWRWCVLPLRNLALLVESLHWGQDTFRAPSPGPLPELREMRRALSELSRRAVDREELKRNYVGDIVRTQEEERARLAREIHDSPLQTVASLIQRIQLASRGITREEIDRERVGSHLAAAQEAAMNAVQEMRDVCDRLAPPWTSLGASRAFDEIARRLSRVHNLEVTAAVEGDDEFLTEKDVLSLSRIVQEAVANAARHGHATSVEVKLKCEGESALLTVRDNGCGIASDLDPELLRVQGHRGIASMNERASLIGAQFSIRAAEGGGTLITVNVPAGRAQTAGAVQS